MADPNVWMRPFTKLSGESHYKYILCYVDDKLCIGHDASRPMEEIKRTLKFKNNKVVEPDFYLGATIKKKELNSQRVWTMSSQEYIKKAIKTIKDQLKKQGKKLPPQAITPMSAGYYPEMDLSPKLDQEGTILFQELIGLLHCAVEIGRVGILTELSMLSSYQVSPREGHLEQIYHIFAFLKKNPKPTLYFDPQEPMIDLSWFTSDDRDTFLDQYQDAEEQLPDGHLFPKPLGVSVSITAYVDSSHAANKVTRRSHTGFIIFLNNKLKDYSF